MKQNHQLFWAICLLSVCGMYGCGDGGLSTSSDGASAVCGNGVVETGELCDDGNTTDGDGCRQDCLAIERGYTCPPEGGACSSEATCGNGVVEAGEACDDGNTVDGDGCSADCQTLESGETCPDGDDCTPEATCGNAYVEGDEACDDGNTSDGDGCAADCSAVESGYTCPQNGGPCTKKPTEMCGNGKLEVGEECDYDVVTGYPENGDGCDTDCHIEEGYSCSATDCWPYRCQNGYLEPGEACDSGEDVIAYGLKDDGTRGCTSACTLAPYCGDGHIDEGYEQCDDGDENGTSYYGDGCDSNCQRLPYCGDGIFTHDINGVVYEECDPSVAGYVDGCTAECKAKTGWSCNAVTGVCVNIEEQCLTGNCDEHGNYVAKCNNGVYDFGMEECDDTSQAGCAQDCTTEDGYKCIGSGIKCTTDCTSLGVECVKIGYGDGKIDKDGYEQCDDGNTIDGDGCSAKGQIEPGYQCPTAGEPCVAAKCGDGIRAIGEECDDGNNADGDGCSARCRIEDSSRCTVNELGGKSECEKGYCGDGKILKNEQCELGQSNCSAYCKLITRDLSRCGDGTIDRDRGEECDDGNLIGGDGCSPTCTIESAFECYDNGIKTQCTPICGDGITMWMIGDASEECDDGNNISGDGCSADCKIEYGYRCTDFSQNAYPDSITLPVTFRDFIGVDRAGTGNGYVTAAFKAELEQDADCKRTPQTSSKKDNTTVWTNIQPLKTGYGHPDFQNFTGNLCKNILEKELDDGHRPVFSGNINASCCGDLNATECAKLGTSHNSPQNRTIGSHLLCGASFDTWFSDDERINKTVESTLYMEKVSSTEDSYVFDSQFPPMSTQAAGAGGVLYSTTPAYFNPLAYAGFKDHRSFSNIYCYDASNKLKDCNSFSEFSQYGITSTYKSGSNTLTNAYTVNGSFTTEVHSYFQYKPSAVGATSTLEFTGDDDVWVFINDRLFVDLGGMHSRATGSGTLSAQQCSNGQLCDPNFEVYEGGVYDMRVFQTERHASGSNFKLTLTGFLNSGVSTCATICGDGKVAGNEACDEGTDGVRSNFLGCTPQCTKKSTCGNGIAEGSEKCDSGFLCDVTQCLGAGYSQSTCEKYASYCTEIGTHYDAEMGCDTTCSYTGAICGNGVREGAEECDDPSDSKCNTETCRFRVCGDGTVDPGEECDNGRGNGFGVCTQSCTLSRCGDGIVDTYNGEVCDDGDGNNTGAYGKCGLGCTYWGPRCGDGIVNGSEECDNGASNNANAYGRSACTDQCKRAPYCGDGIVNGTEECDGTSDCTSLCQKAIN